MLYLGAAHRHHVTQKAGGKFAGAFRATLLGATVYVPSFHLAVSALKLPCCAVVPYHATTPGLAQHRPPSAVAAVLQQPAGGGAAAAGCMQANLGEHGPQQLLVGVVWCLQGPVRQAASDL